MANTVKGSNASTELASLEMQAKENAKLIVANYFQRPDQLEKTEQLRKAVARQKGSVEAMLKTAIQSQLDGVKTGLNQLSAALKDVREIKNDLVDIKSTYQIISHFESKLKNIKEENSRHSQLAAACDNVQHIFTVPETITKCEELILEGKLLHAHKSISYLERSRDDILYELHKQSVQRPGEKLMVMQYFSGLDNLIEALSKQLWLILQRTIISVRMEPTIIVTVVRIIEREEKMDEFAVKRYDQMKLQGRPKQWRKKAFETMSKAVLSRVEGNQMEDRTTNKMWLVRHLEVTRQIVLEDLKVVKSVCEPCFPPHYDIVERYIDMYHSAISSHVNEIVEQGLEGNEIISLLNWVNDYPGRDLMGHPDLNVDVEKYPPLLSEEKVAEMHTQYVITLRANMKEWMANSLKTDVKDWSKEHLPDADDKGFFSTSLPVLIIQMVEQNLDVAKTIGPVLVLNVVNMCVDEVKDFARAYRNELRLYRDVHLADRKTTKYYLHFVIANANNCQAFSDFIGRLRQKYLTESDAPNIKVLLDSFATLIELLCVWLVEEIFYDLDPHLQEFLTKKWVTNKELIDSICMTIEDYFQDFVHMRSTLYNELHSKVRLRIAKEFYKSLTIKKLVFKDHEERYACAVKLIKEIEQLNALFEKLRRTPSEEDQTSPLNAIFALAELLKLRDTSLMALEVSGFIKSYHDFKMEMLVNVLLLRGDLTKGEARQTIEECIGEDFDARRTDKKTVFSLI